MVSGMTRKRAAVLISGRGSNMAALIEAAAEPGYPAEIALVLANSPDAAGLERAAAAGIATTVVDHRRYGKDREAFERALQASARASMASRSCAWRVSCGCSRPGSSANGTAG